MTMDEFTNQHLAGSVGVHVRGVDEIPARRAVGLINLAGFVFSGTPTPILAKCHGAERHFCNSQTAIPQESIFHCFDLSSRNFGSQTIVQWIRSQELALQILSKKQLSEPFAGQALHILYKSSRKKRLSTTI
jgi:hypothetical protein